MEKWEKSSSANGLKERPHFSDTCAPITYPFSRTISRPVLGHGVPYRTLFDLLPLFRCHISVSLPKRSQASHSSVHVGFPRVLRCVASTLIGDNRALIATLRYHGGIHPVFRSGFTLPRFPSSFKCICKRSSHLFRLLQPGDCNWVSISLVERAFDSTQSQTVSYLFQECNHDPLTPRGR